MKRYSILFMAVLALAPVSVWAQSPGTIVTVAGGFIGDNNPATAASLSRPTGVAVDGSGNLYITDKDNHRIRKVASTGIITTVAGTGNSGFSGDGGPATAASLYLPTGVTVDGTGNLYIADQFNHRIRKVASTGIITTVAGTGTAGFSGDGGAATAASLNYPYGVRVDGTGTLYISDEDNHRIRKVASTGIITTVAGDGFADANGNGRFAGDGGLATAASLYFPTGVAVDGTGNLYIADKDNHRIRKVIPSGLITTVTGDGFADANGSGRFAGDGGLAIAASLNFPTGVTVDGTGNLYIADIDNSRIRKVASNGIITTAAGTGTRGFSGDGGSAAAASLYFPRSVVVDGTGNLYIADQLNNRIRKVTSSSLITTVAGGASIGDGGLATAATLDHPEDIFLDSSGNLYIGDRDNNRIRKVASNGIITTVIGTGTRGFSGDGGLAAAANVDAPRSAFIDGNGNLYFADSANHRIRKVTPSGIITTVAGSGLTGQGNGSFSGDGGLAIAASLNYPESIVLDGSGNLYIADDLNHRIRKVTPSGIITTVAGNGTGGFAGDGGSAAAASLNYPASVFLDSSGNLFIGDSGNYRVRKVASNGIITTVAGTGTAGFTGDGGPATAARLGYLEGIWKDAAGNLYIADYGNHRVRKVDTNGIITTVAGNGTGGFSGDGGSATAASLRNPIGVFVDRRGDLYIADYNNSRIRKAISAAVGALSSVSNGLQSLTTPTSNTAKRVAVQVTGGTTGLTAELAYRQGGQKRWKRLSMTVVGADSLVATIPAADVTHHGLDLYVKTTYSSTILDSTAVSVLRVTIPAGLSSGSAIVLPQATAKDTSDASFKTDEKANFRMLSIPIALDGSRSAQTVLGSQLGIGDATKGRIFRWNGSRYSEATADNLDPGKAFWVISTTAPPSITVGAGRSSDTQSPPSLSINQNGFTQIGVPYTFAVPYDSIRAHNPTLDSRAWLWTGGGYTEITTRLEPWQGYWIKSTGTATAITVPPADADALPKPLPPVTQPVVPDGWALRVVAEAGPMVDRYNYLGVSAQATERWDPLDFAEPPPLGAGTVALYFPHADWPILAAGNYAGDFRPSSAEGHTWEFTVEAGVPRTTATVTVLDVDQLPPDRMALLVDLDTGRTLMLRDLATLTFPTGAQGTTRHFNLIVGTAAYIGQVKATLLPRTFALEPNYPNPFNPTTTIRFALPQTVPVRLVVHNILGQEVKVLVDQVMPAGYHQMVWDGTNRRGQRVASGVYVYAIQAGSFRQSRKMALVK